VESALNYTLRGRLFRPDVVIIHHGINDNPAEVRKTYRADYSHYRHVFTLPTVSLLDRLLSHSVLHSWLRLRTGDDRMDLKSRATQPIRDEDVYMDTLPPESNFRAYREALRSIVTLAHADGAAVIVAGMAYRMGEPECPLIERNNDESARVAQEQKAVFIDLQRQFAFRQDFFKDVVHVHSGGNEIKGNMLASAVAKVIGERPSVWMSTPTDRHDEITIQWRDFGKEHDMIDLYLRVADGDLQFLTRLPKDATSFVWKRNQPGVAPAFRDGPQPGVQYECCVYTLLEGKIQSPLFMVR